MMDSSTASQRCLFSIATPPAAGTDESLEKATWMEGNGSGQNSSAGTCHHPIWHGNDERRK
jgi:hypothetical protein